MANFQLAPKKVIINDEDGLQFQFFTKTGNAYAVNTLVADANDGGANEHEVDIASSDLLKIQGIGDFFKGNLVKFSASRAVPGTKEISTITFTTSGLTAGKEFYLDIKQASQDLPAELAKYDSEDYSRTRPYQIITKTGDTPTTIAQRVIADINSDEFEINFRLYTATQSGAVITLTSIDPAVTVKATIRAADSANTGMVGVTHAVTTEGYSGRNTYDQLKGWRLETPANSSPYASNRDELPLKKGKYTCLLITQRVDRPDLSGPSTVNEGPVSGVHGWELYINETLGAKIRELVAFFETAPAKVFYPAVTSAAALSVEAGEATKTNYLVGLPTA